MQTITIGSNSYNLVTVPASPAPSAVEIAMVDTVAVNTSPFTGVQQMQLFPGGDHWEVTVSLPPMYAASAASWRAFLAELRGKSNVFQIGDPTIKAPRGVATGTPIIETAAQQNAPMTTLLYTGGWTPNTTGILLAGDQIQVGYRLYLVCENANADLNGYANLTIWPSIRETPANGMAITLANPTGLFRLADNRRVINWSPSRLTTLSVKAVEAR